MGDPPRSHRDGPRPKGDGERESTSVAAAEQPIGNATVDEIPLGPGTVDDIPAGTGDLDEDDGPATMADSPRSKQTAPLKPKSAPDLPPGTKIGRYVVLRRIGSGGMGVVFLARDPHLGRELAIKLWHPSEGSEATPSEAQERLLREAQGLARLSHAHVVTVYDVGKFLNQVFVAMEFVEGMTLRQWLIKEPRPWREILRLYIEAGRGLVAAHGAGLVHRDFKPANVLVGNDGRIKVADFGLVRAVQDSLPNKPRRPAPRTPAALAAVTQVGAVMGTPGYMAPEVLAGQPPEPAADQYAFSVGLREGLFGERPDVAKRPNEVDVPRPCDYDEMPDTLREVVDRGLAEEPEARYASMIEMLGELSSFLAEKRPSFAVPDKSQAGAPDSGEFVGRLEERQKLQAAFETAVAGHAHLALIAGEPGIGKSRLAEELLQWARNQGLLTARTRSYAAEGRLAYAPATEWLRSPSHREAILALDDVWLTEIARLLPEILTERPDLKPPDTLSERWQGQRLYEALARAVLAPPQPLVLAIDDLQWCDQETLTWLRFLLRFDLTAQLLIVGTVRPEEIDETHPLTSLLGDIRGNGQLTEIALEPLDESETLSLAAHVLGEELSPELAARLFRETEGNPLFVVETMRAGGDQAAAVESPAPAAEPAAGDTPYLPPKVQAVIESRLAQLSPLAQKLTRVAAVIGREFTFELLAQASGVDEEEVVEGLDELWQRKVMQERGANAYDFAHDKIREVAYLQVSPVRRRLLHRRVAEALEALYSTSLDRVAGRIAAHCEEAGSVDRAIDFYRRAAEVAQQVYANGEAIRLLTRALALLETMPETPERRARELEIEIPRGTSLLAFKGYADPESQASYTRALELCRQVGDTSHLSSVLYGLWVSHTVQGKHQKALEHGEQLVQLAPSPQEPTPEMVGHLTLGHTLFYVGEALSAHEHIEKSIELCDPERHRTNANLYGSDPGVFALSLASHLDWYLGHADRAVERVERAIVMADGFAHPFSQAIAHDYAAMLYQFRREPRRALRHAERAAFLCREHGFAYYLAWANIIRGWALSERGRTQEGIDQMQQGLTDLAATGAGLRQPHYLLLQAEALGKDGQIHKGLGLLPEASARLEQCREHYYEAELYRIKGELLQMQGAPQEDVEDFYRQAIESARTYEGRALELRATLRLGRLRVTQKRGDEARRIVGDVYQRFAEGFDTPDLGEARALLDELG